MPLGLQLRDFVQHAPEEFRPNEALLELLREGRVHARIGASHSLDEAAVALPFGADGKVDGTVAIDVTARAGGARRSRRTEGAMDLGLRGAAAAVTGGTQGMGRATAEWLARDGARVAVLARSREELDETEQALVDAGSPDAHGIVCDVSDGDSVASAFEALGKRWGELHILVNTVGPETTGTIEELDDEDWRAALNLGTLSAVRCVRAALPWLRRAEWARIVNVSAHSTHRQSPNLIAYTAAKSALTSVSKNLAKALAPERILVNTVSPGTFLTGGVRRWLEGLAAERGVDATSLEELNRLIGEEFDAHCDLGRAGLPEEIGAVIAFLASRTNSYMTGADVNVDGGSDFV